MKKLLLTTLLLSALVLLGTGTQANAMITADLGAYGTLVALPLTPPTIIDVMGSGGLATQGSVDFAVLHDSSSGVYTYFYQVENLGGGAGDVLGRYTIDNPWGATVLGSGFMADGGDPISLGWNPSTFYADLDPAGGNLAVGEMTNRFYFQFAMPPGVVSSYLIDGGIGYGSVVGPVIPEPTSMLLFGTGLLGLIGLRRKRRKV